jgi:hypothetical protein
LLKKRTIARRQTRATDAVSNIAIRIVIIAEVMSSSEARVGSDIISDILSDTKRFSRILCQIDAIMVKEDTGRFRSASLGRTSMIYVPSDLVKDSAFPFTDGDALLIRLMENAWLSRDQRRDDNNAHDCS